MSLLMAISYIQLLLFVSASLLLLPALGAIDFGYCNKSGYDFGNFSRVEVSPNPVGPDDNELTITVYGYASKRINNVTIEVYSRTGKDTNLLGVYYICKVGNACVIKSGLCFSDECPIEAGTNFVLPISKVPQDFLEADDKYFVSLLDDVDIYSEDVIERMCVDFSLPTLAPTLDSA